jgi:hypothetical protein
VLIATVLAATTLALAGYLFAGRIVGFAITAICGAAMAFFLMPPVFSFRISHPRDMLTLALYGTAGLVFAKAAPRKRRAAGEVYGGGDRDNLSESTWAQTLGDVMTSHAERATNRIRIVSPAEGTPLRCQRLEARHVLSDVLEFVQQTAGSSEIRVYAARLPGVQRLTLVADYSSPKGDAVSTIGKRDEDCHAVAFPEWPASWSATWFDNGHQKIYQVSLRAC